MTEAEWVASEDPAAMLEAVRDKCGGGWPGGGRERKVRLWVEACRGHAERADPGRTWSWGNLHGQSALDQILRTWAGESFASAVPLSLRAHILRDIMGNPFRPAAPLRRKSERVCSRCGSAAHLWLRAKGGDSWYCNQCSLNCHPRTAPACPWLTPAVLGLAQAAYEERAPGRPHKRCGCGRAYELLKRSSTPPLAWCNHCAEDGGWWADAMAREPDGTLDPVRLAVLADALEEAGCDSEPLLRHLRGWRMCRACAREGGRHAHACVCKPTGGWLPDESPHVRGCWAIDLLTGRE